MEVKKIKINYKYYIKILINTNNTTNLYILKDSIEEKTIVESFNVYSFIQKANPVVKISKAKEKEIMEV